MKVEDYLKKNIQELNMEISKGGLHRNWKELVGVYRSFETLFPGRKMWKQEGPIRWAFSLVFLFVIGAVWMDLVPNYFPHSKLWQGARFLISFFGFLAVFGFAFFLFVKFDITARFRRKIIRKNKRGGVLQFSRSEYEKAAQILKKFKKCSYEKAVKEYGEKYIALLVIANRIFMEKGRGFFGKKYLKRLVSVRSIERDGEAER